MSVTLFCSLCGQPIEGQVVKVAAYSKPVSQEAEDFLQAAGRTDELGTAFAHPECAERLSAVIVESFRNAADVFSVHDRQQERPSYVARHARDKTIESSAAEVTDMVGDLEEDKRGDT